MAPPACLLAGGETTVTLRGQGKGGRNQELALAAAIALEGVSRISLLSAGTDGTDGPTDAAGAFVDGATCQRARPGASTPETFCPAMIPTIFRIPGGFADHRPDPDERHGHHVPADRMNLGVSYSGDAGTSYGLRVLFSLAETRAILMRRWEKRERRTEARNTDREK